MTKKVFISYAHESEQLSDSVLEFSNYLRSQGIDAEIDQYEEAPVEGWPKWMMRQVQEADYVLVVCSPLFYERANDFSGKSEGGGVKWETNLILQQLYNLNTQNDKFIPIVFNRSSLDSIPLPLQPYTHYCVSEEAQKVKLKNRLLGLNQSKRPALGEAPTETIEAPALEAKERKIMFMSSVVDIDLWNKAQWKAMSVVADMDFRNPPILGFVYDNNKAGAEIFRRLKKQFGAYDKSGEIRLSIVEQISEAAPQDYKIHFGSNWKVVIDKMEQLGIVLDESLMVTISRHHEMNPSDDRKMSLFKCFYERFGTFFITNVEMDKSGQLAPNIENLIRLDNINFRTKKEIIDDKNDPDYVVFSSES